MDPLIVTLRLIRRRLAVRRWIHHAVFALFVSSSASCLWVILTRLFPILGEPEPVYVTIFAAALFVATVLAAFRRPSLLRAALEGDRSFALEERLTSSYELADSQGPMLEALHADARCRLAGLDVGRRFPLTTQRSLRWAYVPILLFLLASLFFPELDLLGHRKREAEAKAQKEALRVKAETLRGAVRPLAKIPEETNAAVAQAEQGLFKIADDLENQDITDKQALARLTNLAQALQDQRSKLQKDNPTPKLATDTANLDVTKDLAKAMQKGDFKGAAEKLEALTKKLSDGSLSQEQRDALSKELNQLSNMLANMNADSQLSKALAEALAKAGECMCQSGQLAEGLEALRQAQLSLQDLESIRIQLEQMDILLSQMCGACRGCLGGQPGRYAGIGGNWLEGEGPWGGGGMGNRGHGRGGRVGDLPDVQAGFDPTLLPGELTKGKILASILQRGAPDENAKSNLEYVSGAFVEVRQKAEEALNKEEIPPGSKEFVRQYFGSLEPGAETKE